MVPASQALRSTNWNSGEPGSKRQTRMSDMAKVTSVVHSAIQRALRRFPSVSPPISAMSSAPASGRNVVTDRIGQLTISPPPRQHEPGDQGRHADQHGEGVVIEVSGL